MRKIKLKVDSKLNENQKLWRYMDLPKFISLIDKKALWLARSDTFKDKHEGRFPDEMRKIIELAYDKFDDSDKSIVKDADHFQNFLIKNTFISCWHKNMNENMVMWEIYGKDTNVLAIQTTVKKIETSHEPSKSISGITLLLKDINYELSENISGKLDYLEPFFIKRPHFSYEDETRICLSTYSSLNPTKQTPYGYDLPIKISDLIEKILIHPDSSDWFMEVVNSIVLKYKVGAPVERGLYGTK